MNKDVKRSIRGQQALDGIERLPIYTADGQRVYMATLKEIRNLIRAGDATAFGSKKRICGAKLRCSREGLFCVALLRRFKAPLT
jgi:hypothetical protein